MKNFRCKWTMKKTDSDIVFNFEKTLEATTLGGAYTDLMQNIFKWSYETAGLKFDWYEVTSIQKC